MNYELTPEFPASGLKLGYESLWERAMKVEERDGEILLVSDGSDTDNTAIVVIMELMDIAWQQGLITDDQVNNHGTGSDGEIAKNYIYIPGSDFIPIPEE